MTVYPLCDPYAWEQPNVLIKTGLTPKFHKHGVCISELVNQLVLVYVVAFIFACIVTVLFQNKFAMLAIIGVVTLYSIPNIAVVLQLLRAREGFQDAKVPGASFTPPPVPTGANYLLRGSEDARQYDGSRDVISSNKEQVCKFGYCWEDNPAPVYDVIGGGGAINMPHTLPTTKNPFMNVLIDEIKYNPGRANAISVMDPSIRVGLDDFFRTEFYNDPTDVFGKTQGQRQFVTMPSTSIPNDQDSYQNWLYRIKGKTCKEGGREACLPGTDGGALPWLNSDS